jgi:hypothetical protein
MGVGRFHHFSYIAVRWVRHESRIKALFGTSAFFAVIALRVFQSSGFRSLYASVIVTTQKFRIAGLEMVGLAMYDVRC